MVENQIINQIIERINLRQNDLVNLKDKSDTEIQTLTQEMQKEHLQVVYSEAQADEKDERKKIRKVRNKIEEQQNLLKKYQQIRYRGIVKKSAPKIPVIKNSLAAFLVGGIICSIGQIVKNSFILNGLADKDASTFASVVMVFAGAFLTGLGVYDEIVRFGGAGSMVPISGFANSIVSPALEFKREGYVYGVGAKIFTIAGPVILYGTLISVIIGLIFYITM